MTGNAHQMVAEQLRNRGIDDERVLAAMSRLPRERFVPPDLHAPYDGIIVTAAAPEIPDDLVAQLAPGGRLVVPVGTREAQCLRIMTRHDGTTDEETGACVFVPLIGQRGFEG